MRLSARTGSAGGVPHRAPLCLPSQTVMSHSFYPPLMQRTSWTLAAPFKEQQHHRGPSDSIANNYSLTAQDLKLKDLLKVYQPVTVSVPRERPVQGLPSGNRSGAPCEPGMGPWSEILGSGPGSASRCAARGSPWRASVSSSVGDG